MTTETLLRKWAALMDWATVDDVEEFRHAKAGTFGHRMGTNYRLDNGLWKWEQTTDWAYDTNLITNLGLNAYLDYTLAENLPSPWAWYVSINKTTTDVAAGDTYATRGFTEIAASDVSETVRQGWTAGSVSSQSISNSSAATYTADTTVTAYGAILVGGNASGITTIGDTGATDGLLFSGADFATSKAMSSSDTIDITYTFTMADDGA